MQQDVLESIEELARKLPSRMGVKRELKKLPTLLGDDERVLQLDTGTYGGGNGLVVATNRRVMFLLEGLTRSRVEDFPFDEIAAVRSEMGMVTGTCRLTISTYDDQAEISNMSKSVVDEITEYVRSRAGGPEPVEQPQPEAQPQAAAVAPSPTAAPVRREIEGANIVVIGTFEPPVLQPDWFATQGLISHEETYMANVQMNRQDSVAFTTDRFEVKAKRDQLFVGTTHGPSFPRLTDIVTGVLALLQPDVSKLGINRDTHFALASVEAWRDIAQRLAPPTNWDLVPNPGMRSLAIQGSRPDREPGAVLVRVEPSVRVRPGIYIQVNDHFEVSEPPSAEGRAEAARIVSESWDRSMTQAETICRHLLFGTV